MLLKNDLGLRGRGTGPLQHTSLDRDVGVDPSRAGPGLAWPLGEQKASPGMWPAGTRGVAHTTTE